MSSTNPTDALRYSVLTRSNSWMCSSKERLLSKESNSCRNPGCWKLYPSTWGHTASSTASTAQSHSCPQRLEGCEKVAHEVADRALNNCKDLALESSPIPASFTSVLTLTCILRKSHDLKLRENTIHFAWSVVPHVRAVGVRHPYHLACFSISCSFIFFGLRHSLQRKCSSSCSQLPVQQHSPHSEKSQPSQRPEPGGPRQRSKQLPSTSPRTCKPASENCYAERPCPQAMIARSMLHQFQGLLCPDFINAPLTCFFFLGHQTPVHNGLCAASLPSHATTVSTVAKRVVA